MTVRVLQVSLLVIASLVFGLANAAATPSFPRAIGPHACSNYPQAALDQDISGDTTVAFAIGTDGIPNGPSVATSSGNSDLDQAALACILTWRYAPSEDDGKPITVAWKAVVTWHIETVGLAPNPGSAHDCKSIAVTPDSAARIRDPASVYFTVTTEGMVKGAYVSTSGDPTFDDAAKRCVSEWQYKPATRNGQPVAVFWATRVAWTAANGVTVVENFAKPHWCPGVHKGVEGVVTVSFTIGTDGQTKDRTISQTSGIRPLDDMALMCAAHWRYKPATQDTVPVTVPWSAQVAFHDGQTYVLETPPNHE
jgi:TonB family protein